MARILSTASLAPGVSRLWLEAGPIARKRQPGQFVILRIDENGERIPLTIADVDVGRGAISVIVQAVGKTTSNSARCTRETRSRTSSARSASRPTSVRESTSAASAAASAPRWSTRSPRA